MAPGNAPDLIIPTWLLGRMDLRGRSSLARCRGAADSPIKPFEEVLREAETRPRNTLHSPSNLPAILPVANQPSGNRRHVHDARRASLWRRTRPRHVVWLAAPVLLWWALRKVPWEDVAVALSRLGPAQIGILFLVNAVVVVTFSGQLWMILRSQAHAVPFLSLVRYWLAGFAVGYFTPAAQIGSGALLIYLLQQRNAIPLATATASVVLSEVVERVGRATFLLFGITALLQLPLFSKLTNELLSALALGSLALTVGYLLAARRGWRPLFYVLSLLPGKLARRPRYRKLLKVIAETEMLVSDFCRNKPKVMAIGVALSLLSWAFISLETWLAAFFLGFSLRPIEVLAVVTAGQIAFLTPLPGGLGAMEASLVAVFLALGHPSAAAVSFALLIRLRDLALGGLGLWRGVGWHSVRLREADHIGGLVPKP